MKKSTPLLFFYAVLITPLLSLSQETFRACPTEKTAAALTEWRSSAITDIVNGKHNEVKTETGICT